MAPSCARPEAILLDAAIEGSANRMEGSVREAVFLGKLVDYLVEAQGLRLRVQGDRRRLVAPGTAITLAVPVAECVAMPA